MLILAATTDKFQLQTSAASTVDVHVSYADYNGTVVTPGKQNTAIVTATTTDILASPGASTQRNMKTLNVRNKDTALSNDVTVIFNQNATLFELYKTTLKPGEALEYIEGVGFFVLASAAKLDVWQRVTGDIVYATAATMADVTGLTVALLSGKKYLFETHLYHISAATTTGAQFSVNIGAAPTTLVFATFSGVTNSVTAGTISVGSATARDTAATAQTTGSANITLTIMSGFIQPSADGTFAVRATAEVAANMTVKAGSWLHLRECDN